MLTLHSESSCGLPPPWLFTRPVLRGSTFLLKWSPLGSAAGGRRLQQVGARPSSPVALTGGHVSQSPLPPGLLPRGAPCAGQCIQPSTQAWSESHRHAAVYGQPPWAARLCATPPGCGARLMPCPHPRPPDNFVLGHPSSVLTHPRSILDHPSSGPVTRQPCTLRLVRHEAAGRHAKSEL